MLQLFLNWKNSTRDEYFKREGLLQVENCPRCLGKILIAQVHYILKDVINLVGEEVSRGAPGLLVFWRWKNEAGRMKREADHP